MRRRARSAAMSSSCRSTRWPSAARASRGSATSGYVVFVAGAIPGDRVRAVVHKRKRSYAHARTLEVLDPSPERIAPAGRPPRRALAGAALRAPAARSSARRSTKRCGGSAGWTGFELEEIVPAVEQWRYRNKLEYSFGSRRRRRRAAVCGFHAPAGGNRVAPIDDCLLASERGNLAREVALRWCREQGLCAWDRGGARAGAPRRACGRDARRRAGAGRARAAAQPRRARRPAHGQAAGPHRDHRRRARGRRAGGRVSARRSATSLAGVLWTRSRSLAETTAGGDTELVWGEAELPERLGELDLRISAEAFFQTNTEMAERLYDVVVEYAALEGWERVYDLYCGIGTIALTLAPRAGRAVGDRAGRTGRRRRDRGSARATRSPRRTSSPATSAWRCPSCSSAPGARTSLVVDPPRAGLSKKVVHRIIDASPKRIVYVSCNPTTLAPNAAELVEAGWALPQGAPRRHVPADAPHRVRRAARAGRWGGHGLRVGFRAMRAATIRDEEIVIEEHPDPVPGTGEVLVRRARGRAERRRHDAAARAVPGAARLAAGHPRHGARRRGRWRSGRAPSASPSATA